MEQTGKPTIPSQFKTQANIPIKSSEYRSKTPQPERFSIPIHSRSKTPPSRPPPLSHRPHIRRHTAEFQPILCNICNETYTSKATYEQHEKSQKHVSNETQNKNTAREIKKRVIEGKIEAYKIVMKNLQNEIDELTVTLSSF